MLSRRVRSFAGEGFPVVAADARAFVVFQGKLLDEAGRWTSILGRECQGDQTDFAARATSEAVCQNWSPRLSVNVRNRVVKMSAKADSLRICAHGTNSLPVALGVRDG
jgi:hypothetical protein